MGGMTSLSRALSGPCRTYGHEDLLELENGLIRTYYLKATADRSPYWAELAYLLGRESYRRRVVYRATNSGTPLDFARALVELADWDLLFSRNGKALERYDEAYALLIAAGVPDTSIRELFPTDTPVLLPTFQPNPFAADEAGASSRHIDLAFELSKYGESRKIRLVDASDDSMADFEKDAIRLIASNRFRPRPSGDAADRAGPYRVRYYVSP
jgi:hypothetical protein